MEMLEPPVHVRACSQHLQLQLEVETELPRERGRGEKVLQRCQDVLNCGFFTSQPLCGPCTTKGSIKPFIGCT